MSPSPFSSEQPHLDLQGTGLKQDVTESCFCLATQGAAMQFEPSTPQLTSTRACRGFIPDNCGEKLRQQEVLQIDLIMLFLGCS